MEVKGREEGRAGFDSVVSVCGDGGGSRDGGGKEVGPESRKTQTASGGSPPKCQMAPEGQCECNARAREGNAAFQVKRRNACFLSKE